MQTEPLIKTYNLSQSFTVHTAAVRSVSYSDSILLSGSSDKLAKVFAFDGKQYHLINSLDIYQNYIYATCVRIGGGFAVASGNQIFLHDIEGNPVGILDGHSGQVCSLSSKYLNILVSGSWDGTAIVWDLDNKIIKYRLEGHKYGVAVLHTDNQQEIITGSQDGKLRKWINGKEVKVVDAHLDIIREITEVPGIGFVTCSNDETIKVWTTNIEQISVLLGHNGFVFSVKQLSLFQQLFFISGSDDNSVRIWSGAGEQLQSINHPATVWQVTINQQNGDIITACADGKVRVFTHYADRYAQQDELDQFEKEVQLAAAQGPGGLSQEQIQKMPSLEQQNSIRGKKDGEVKIFKNGNKPEVYAWKQDQSKWEKIGDIVGGSNKKKFAGDQYFSPGEYDYLFDVDDDSGVPKLLPVNEGDNHLDVAERFCKREGYSKGYLGQVMNFLKQNTKPPQPKQVQTITSQKFEKIPYTQYFFYEQMNLDGLLKKVTEFNQILKTTPEGLTDLELYQFNQAVEVLKNTQFYHTSQIDTNVIQTLNNKLLKWPSQYMIPIYDFLRIIETHHSSEKLFSGLDSGINILTEMQVHVNYHKQSAVFQRLILQTICNLFKQNAGTYAALRHIEIVFNLLQQSTIMEHLDQKVSDLISNVILNYSVAVYQRPGQANEAGSIISKAVVQYLQTQRDQISVSKAVTAIGNLTQSGDLNTRKQAKLIAKDLISQIQLQDQEAQKCIDEVKISISRI